MNELIKIQYIRKLEEEKQKLEQKKQMLDKKIENLNSTIREQIESCSHMYVKLFGDSNIDVCYCVLCGKAAAIADLENKFVGESISKIEGWTTYVSENVINAENYLSQGCWMAVEKIDHIQNIIISIFEENPSITREELFQKLKSLIENKTLVSETQASDFEIDSPKVKAKV